MSFVYERLVEWGDCDDFGIVYYPHYFEWFDSAFHRMCLSKGYTQRNIREFFGAQGTPLIDTNATFNGPSTYGDTIAIHAAFSHWGRTSMVVDYAVVFDEKVLVTGVEKRVWVNPKPGGGIAPAPIPPRFRDDLCVYDKPVS